MRVARVMVRPQTHTVEELAYPFRQIPALGQVMDLERLTHDGPDGHARIQRAVGILEHDLHAAARGPQRLGIHGEQVLAFKRHVAARGFLQPQHGAAHGGLAAAGLPDQPEGFPGLDIERHVVHSLDPRGHVREETAPDGEIFLEVRDLKKGHLRSLP